MSLLATSKCFRQSHSSHHNAMVNSFRFMNSDTYFNRKSLTILLRVLESDSCENREKWFLELRACRRRRQIVIDGSQPVSQVFKTKTELDFLEYNTIVRRIQVCLEELGEANLKIMQYSIVQYIFYYSRLCLILSIVLHQL